jgi:hypothetical protein
MSAQGWPFLIGAGRRRDYSTLMAPDFLVEALDYGVLDESVRPGSDGSVEVRTASGRRLTIVSATRPVKSVRDEHGRPLRLMYGFVCVDGSVPVPAAEDLATAFSVAWPVYEEFLADEDRLAVEPSAGFPLRSVVVRLTPPALLPAVRNRAALLLGGGVLAVGLTVTAAVSMAGEEPPRPPVPSVSPAPSPSPSRSISPSPSPRVSVVSKTPRVRGVRD